MRTAALAWELDLAIIAAVVEVATATAVVAGQRARWASMAAAEIRAWELAFATCSSEAMGARTSTVAHRDGSPCDPASIACVLARQFDPAINACVPIIAIAAAIIPIVCQNAQGCAVAAAALGAHLEILALPTLVAGVAHARAIVLHQCPNTGSPTAAVPIAWATSWH